MSASIPKLPPESRRRMFEVAIICALDVESTAVEATFDDIYDATSYGKAPRDTNAYRLGRIGSHYVVLTYLPSIGKASAAAAAACLALSFSNIRLGLLVGICGGVPSVKEQGSTREIVLGDVVIGTGVVQYDLGHQYDGGRPVRKCSVQDNLSRAPPEIRSFLHKCKAGIERREIQKRMQQYVEELCSQVDFRVWGKPPIEQDLLYESDYLHQHRDSRHCNCSALDGHTCASAREVSCEEIDCCKQRTISRARHAHAVRTASAVTDSHIHWGRIASGDSVIRSAKVRDDIAAAENVIAFDMEGSGLWETFPTVIIKGVCDYADSHKNKTWQKFAALAAAAGAKALLHSWVPESLITENADLVSKHLSWEALPKPKSPAWLVPFDQQRTLVGRRDEVKRITSMLFRRSLFTRTAIAGLGGIGKSRLALEIATSARKEHRDLSVYWIQCSSLVSFERDCRKVIQHLEVPGASDLSNDPKALMCRYLSQEDAGRWLLILDSADDEDLWSARAATSSKLINYIPTGQHGDVLVTSRNDRVAGDIAQQQIVKIAELDPQESHMLLQDLLGGQTEILKDAGKVTQLLNYLTHLPLAIVQAAAYINHNSLDDIDQYLQVWNKQNEDEIMQILSEEFTDNTRYHDGQNPVAKTWLISFKAIMVQHPLAVQILSFMACLDPRDMLYSCLPPLEKSPFNASPLQQDKAFGTLKNYAFIQVLRRESSDKSYNMHRLVHLAVRDYLRHEARFAECVQLTSKHLLSLMPRSGTDMTSYWHKYLHHAERVVATIEIADGLIQYDLLEVLADAYLAIGSFAKAFGFRQTLTQCLMRNPESNSQRLVINVTALSQTLIQQGRYEEALSIAEDALALYTKFPSSGDSDLVTLKMALADANRCVGSCEEALKLAQQAVQLAEYCENHHGKSRNDVTVRALQTLSSCYQSLQRFQDQEKTLLKAIGLLKGSADQDQAVRKAELNMLLARVYSALEKPRTAERLLIPVKRMLETHLGRTHRLTLSSFARLGEVYIMQDRLSDAEALYKSLLSMHAEVGRFNDSDVLHARNDLANVLIARDEYREAKDLQLKTIGMAFLLSKKDNALTLHHVETLS